MAGIGKAKKHVIDGGQAADEGVVLDIVAVCRRASRSAFAPLRQPMPATETVPLAGRSNPFNAAISVVFPTPDGPTIAVTAPSSKASDTLRKIPRLPRQIVRRSTVTAATGAFGCFQTSTVMASARSFRWRYLARKLQAAGQSSGASKNSACGGRERTPANIAHIIRTSRYDPR